MDENGGNKKTYQINKKKDANQGGGLAKFIWNSESGEFLGRNGSSWFKITLFYLVFYFFLACFFLLFYYIFSLTLSEDKPRWIGAENIIGTNPGMGVRPMPDPNKNEMSSLVWINGHKDAETSEWGNQLDDFLQKKYRDLSIIKKCTYENGEISNEEGACEVDVDTFTECTKGKNMYGYTGTAGTPCVLVKLNKIFGWTPVPYTAKNEDMKTAEERKMPKHLMDRIKGLSESDKQINTTWVSCEGENPHDRDFIGDNLKYYAPGITGEFPGIPNFYFPFLKQKDGYESPFIFVKFPQLPKDVLIQIECKAWAKNIIANRMDKLGSVHFELLYTN